MTHLQRMIDSSETDAFEHRLLRSASQEQPSPESVAVLRASLGLQATVLSRISALSSWQIAVLAISVSALLGLRDAEPAGSVALRPAPQSMPVPRAPRTALTSDAAGRADPGVTLPAPSSSAAEILPRTGSSTLDTPRARGSERVRPSAGPDLHEEIRLMDAARNALQARQAQAALDAIEKYDVRFPTGTFKQEAAVLKIQALALRGDTSKAHSMAKRFIKENPGSPYVNRASRVVEHSAGETP